MTAAVRPQVLVTPAEVRRRVAGRRVAFVPTMGYLHEGHATLIRAAREAAGPDGLVVVSVFVNPMQFGKTEDLDAYPRTLAQDAQKLDQSHEPDDAHEPCGTARVP